MKIPFFKMHGAANDFILVDDRTGQFPLTDRAWLARIAARRTGVGCEGIILIQPSVRADFRMRFVNPDGSEVEMCGNGARCVARLAADIGAAPARMTIETVAGLLQAERDGDDIRLRMTAPKDWRLGGTLALEGREQPFDFVNTGVPHAVVFVDDLETIDVQRVGAAIRYHADFKPAGANANFVSVAADGSVRVRTYERGVEAETLACGTGMVASALVAARTGRTRSSPVTVRPASGDRLAVGFRLTPDGASDVTLTGPAEYVFEGVMNYP